MRTIKGRGHGFVFSPFCLNLPSELSGFPPSLPALYPSIHPFFPPSLYLALQIRCVCVSTWKWLPPFFFFFTGRHAHSPQTHNPCFKMWEFLFWGGERLLFVLTHCGCMCVLGQRHTRRGRGWGSRHCSLQGKQHLHSYSDRTQTQTHYLLPNIHQLTQLTRDGCPLKDMHSGDPRLSFCAHAQNIAGIDPERVNLMSPKTSRCFKWPMLCQFTHARMHKLSVTALFICKHTSCQPSSPVLSLTLSLENCLGCFVTVCICFVSLIPRKKKIGHFDLSVDCFLYLNHFSSVI